MIAALIRTLIVLIFTGVYLQVFLDVEKNKLLRQIRDDARKAHDKASEVEAQQLALTKARKEDWRYSEEELTKMREKS